jgi:hypothetical protein
MINPATNPHDKLNPFTHMIVEYDVLGWKSHWVRLRNGELVRPVYIEAEDDGLCEDCFRIDYYRWNLDGTSVTSSDYDMMEIVKK